MRCGRCQSDNRDGVKFCEECGGRLLLNCASCGAELLPDKRFCGACGTPVSPQPADRFASPQGYTPKHLAEKILTSKGALEGERKQVTILFADLKGSMELLADRDPEEARKLLDPVLERMMEAVHRYEGTVNQVMGDGIMALFGAPRRPRGSRGARLPRRHPHAGDGGLVRGGIAPRPGHRRADPRRPQLGRGGRARHRQRPAHGLLGHRPDDAPGRAHGAARPARHDADHRRDAAPRRGLRRGEAARAGARQGPARARGGLRDRPLRARSARACRPRRRAASRRSWGARSRWTSSATHWRRPARARASSWPWRAIPASANRGSSGSSRIPTARTAGSFWSPRDVARQGHRPTCR